MTDFRFPPAGWLELTPAFLIALLLVAGLAGGELLRRVLRLPRIVGYAAVGVGLGPSGLGWLDAQTATGVRIFFDIALGLILFELGFRLDLKWMRRNPWLLATIVGECALSFGAVFFAVRQFGYGGPLAAMTAAIALAVSPAVILMVARDNRAEGQLTERLLAHSAVSGVLAYFLVTMLMPLLRWHASIELGPFLFKPLLGLALALVAGWCMTYILLVAARLLGKREDLQFILLVAAIVLVADAAQRFGFSALLALLIMGIGARNLDERHAMLPVQFGPGGQLFVVVLFVLTGAALDLGAIAAAGPPAAALIVARFLGKGAGLLALGYMSGLRPGGAGWLAVGLLPMSSLAVVMAQDVALFAPEMGGRVAALVVAAVAVLVLLGPLATQFALRASGEARPNGEERGEA